jgi:cell division protein FtsB
MLWKRKNADQSHATIDNLISDIKDTTNRVSKDIADLKLAVEELYKRNAELVKEIRNLTNGQ